MTTPKPLTSLTPLQPQARPHPPLSVLRPIPVHLSSGIPKPQESGDDATVDPAGERLRVLLTLEGDPYLLRDQAKSAGYTFAGRSWHREISTPLLNGSALELDRAGATLRGLVREETAHFDCSTSTAEPTVR